MKTYQYREFVISFNHQVHDDNKLIIPYGSIINICTGEEGATVTVGAQCKTEKEADIALYMEVVKRVRTENWKA